MVKTLTPPVDTAELDDQVPSNDVTLLVSVKSPCATTAVEERSADTARVTSVNMAAGRMSSVYASGCISDDAMRKQSQSMPSSVCRYGWKYSQRGESD
jgi:hypothetical protein